MKRNKSSLIIKGLLIFLLCFISFSAGFNMITPPSVTYKTSYNKKEIKKVATQYLSVASYSEPGLIEALSEYEHFDKDKTTEIIKKMDIDWQKQANDELERYLNSSGFSEKQIRRYLKRDKFTDEQIDKAIEDINPNWNIQANKCRESLLKAGAEKSTINTLLKLRGFTDEQIT